MSLRFFCYAIIGAFLISTFSLRAFARPTGLTPNEECTETMMEAQGQYAYLLASHYGPSGTINFTSNVDVPNMNYSFSADAGSLYGSQTFTLSASGTFNAITSQWEMSSSGLIGGTAWSSSGSSTDPPMLTLFNQDSIPFLETTTSEVTYTQTASQTVSEGTITVRSDLTNNIIRKTLRHNVRTAAGVGQEQWVWYVDSVIGPDGKEIKEQSNGDSPVNGGAGHFYIQTVEAPEPIGAGALVAMLFFARRSRH